MDDFAAAFEAALVGRSCRAERREADWSFNFPPDAALAVGCHWRVISNDGILLTDEDDKQWFGLPEPVDAEARASELLAGAMVQAAKIDRVTADLSLHFSNGYRLDLTNNSSGYEGWQGTFQHAGRGASIIALGGGGLTVF
ncbi:MAG: hypothetical protein ACK4FG_02835 [Brevundimonas sp.]